MNRTATIVLLVVLTAAFLVGIVQLFKLRFEAGDVYPEYSSLRADPLGTKAYYESLQQVRGIEVQRFYQLLHKMPAGASATFFVLGWPVRELKAEREELRRLEAFLHTGGRLVISLRPAFDRSALSYSGGAAPGPGSRRARRQEDDTSEVRLDAQWGFHVDFEQVEQFTDKTFMPVSVSLEEQAPLPTNLLWHSALVFTNADTNWHTIYVRGTNAVLMERKLGAGSVVIASDTFFASNEALRNERHAALLAWLAGPNQRVFFDETHLGVLENPGIASLARKYHLHGTFLALLALAGLLIWKSSVSFVPRTSEPVTEAHVLGLDAASGFAKLLRRSVPKSELLELCWSEWKKAFAHDRRVTPRKREQIESFLVTQKAARAAQRDPVTGYRSIAHILNQRAFSAPVSNPEPTNNEHGTT